jgi:uncharacterized sulfatase
LLVLIEDLNLDLGTFGHPVVQTPHLDELARQGVRFSQAQCPFPLCNPSRVSLLTGQRPTKTGILDNPTTLEVPVFNGVSLLPRHFRDHGYTVGGVGKIAHNAYFEPSSYDVTFDAGDDSGVSRPGNPVPGDDRVLFFGPYRNGTDGSLGKLRDTKLTDRALGLLDELPRPFLLTVGLTGPHRPFVYPEAYHSLYDAQLDVPALPPEEQSGSWKASVPVRAYRSNIYVDPTYADPEVGRREATVAYWRVITYIDAQVGRLLNGLRQRGLDSNTVIAVVSDHGWSNGLHDRYGKGALFGASTRVPLLLSAPGGLQGREVRAPVETVSLYRTLSELCELPVARQVDGSSLVPWLFHPGEALQTPAFSMTTRHLTKELARMVQTSNYKFVFWPTDGDHQLYDLLQDPGEYHNLYGDPAFDSVAQGLFEDLKEAGLWPFGQGSRTFGNGLAGSLGIPQLDALSGPVPGESFPLRIGNSSGLPTLALHVTGIRQVSWPLLGGELLVDPLVMRPFALGPTGSTLHVVIPDYYFNYGARAFMQSLQLDPAAPQGVSFSPGLQLFIGQ